jgi:hypothetical protein
MLTSCGTWCADRPARGTCGCDLRQMSLSERFTPYVIDTESDQRWEGEHGKTRNSKETICSGAYDRGRSGREGRCHRRLHAWPIDEPEGRPAGAAVGGRNENRECKPTRA